MKYIKLYEEFANKESDEKLINFVYKLLERQLKSGDMDEVRVSTSYNGKRDRDLPSNYNSIIIDNENFYLSIERKNQMAITMEYNIKINIKKSYEPNEEEENDDVEYGKKFDFQVTRQFRKLNKLMNELIDKKFDYVKNTGNRKRDNEIEELEDLLGI